MKIKGREIPVSKLPQKAAEHIRYTLQIRRERKRAAYYLQNYRSGKRDDGVIKAAFIAQMPEVWDKQRDLFRYLMEDARFSPVIIYVREYDFIRKSISPEGRNEIAFYIEQYGDDHVIDYFEHTDMDLSEYDYLFYDRPYNNYLPEKLRSDSTVKDSRICLINYSCRDGGGKFGYEDFAKDTYIWFASSVWEYNLHQEEYKNRPYNQCADVGYPAFETYHALITKEGKNRILWTPRWTYDETLGSSHFFEYIDAFIQFAKEHADVTVTIRPHPLMFAHLIEQKAITEEEVEQIKGRCADAGIRFDQNRIVADTFAETDILVTDYSSLIKMFLVMEKPVLYCPVNVEVNEEFEELMQAMYLTHSWEEIEKTLFALTAGEDSLKDIRKKMVSEILLRKKNAAAEIANTLFLDYQRQTGDKKENA